MLTLTQVKNMKTENVIGAVDNLIISSTATDLDRKFEEVMARLRLDYEDKSTLTLSWKGVFIPKDSQDSF